MPDTKIDPEIIGLCKTAIVAGDLLTVDAYITLYPQLKEHDDIVMVATTCSYPKIFALFHDPKELYNANRPVTYEPSVDLSDDSSSGPYDSDEESAAFTYDSGSSDFDTTSDDDNDLHAIADVSSHIAEHIADNITVGDGNPAFNAFAKGLSRLILAGRLELVAPIHAYVNTSHLTPTERTTLIDDTPLSLLADVPLSPTLQQAFYEMLAALSTEEQQRMLAPLLQHRAISTIADPTIYQTKYRNSFDARLMQAYASYLYRESVKDDLGFQSAIKLIRKQFHGLSRQSFMSWWNEHGNTICSECYSLLSESPMRFNQWLDWFNSPNLLNYARHYAQGTSIKDSALLLNFPHIKEKLDNTAAMTEHAFLTWWDIEGKHDYFRSMRTPVTDISAPHKWGGYDEVSLLAADFDLNVGWKKHDGTCMCIVGKTPGVADPISVDFAIYHGNDLNPYWFCLPTGQYTQHSLRSVIQQATTIAGCSTDTTWTGTSSQLSPQLPTHLFTQKQQVHPCADKQKQSLHLSLEEQDIVQSLLKIVIEQPIHRMASAFGHVAKFLNRPELALKMLDLGIVDASGAFLTTKVKTQDGKLTRFCDIYAIYQKITGTTLVSTQNEAGQCVFMPIPNKRGRHEQSNSSSSESPGTKRHHH